MQESDDQQKDNLKEFKSFVGLRLASKVSNNPLLFDRQVSSPISSILHEKHDFSFVAIDRSASRTSFGVSDIDNEEYFVSLTTEDIAQILKPDESKILEEPKTVGDPILDSLILPKYNSRVATEDKEVKITSGKSEPQPKIPENEPENVIESYIEQYSKTLNELLGFGWVYPTKQQNVGLYYSLTRTKILRVMSCVVFAGISGYVFYKASCFVVQAR